MSDGFEESDGRAVWLHDAFGAEVATLEVDLSPLAEVMRDGAALRTKRRLAVVSGVTALVVLPVAAVAFGAGAGRRTGAGPDGFAPSPPRTSAKPPTMRALPPPPVTATLVPPGRNADLPNDDIQVLADGTFHGQHWRLVRDRFVVEGPEGGSVMDDPSQRPHLPYPANWGKHGTIECDFTGIQWGDQPAGSGPGGGGSCNPTDDGPIDGLHGLFSGVSGPVFTPTSDGTRPALTLAGRIDGTDAAWVTVTVDGVVSEKAPVIVVPGEKNDYYVIMMPAYAKHGAMTLTTTVYDAAGDSLGSETAALP